MRRLIDIVILAAVVGGGVYVASTHPREVQHLMRLARDTIAPCTSPITYSLTALDPRFALSTSTLVAHLKQAEAIWEEPSGKKLFEYREHGGVVSVRLIYDDRQAATEKLTDLGTEIDERRASYDSLRARYDALATSIKSQQRAYENEVERYEAREAAYNAEVQKWNAEGGAPPEEYEKLNAEKSALQALLRSVQNRENKLNDDIDKLNALAKSLNQLIAELNLDVEQYNETGARGGEFEEGLYEVKGGIETITIYEFASNTKLIRVLAHEFGHALGLDHVSDDAAIMYQINKGASLTTTNADIAELNTACRTN